MEIASYRSPKTIVQNSSIVGRGLFARDPIARGEIVCVKSGHLLDRATLILHKIDECHAELQIADDLFLAPISPDEFEAVMMFLNHSCAPNVGVQGQIVFVAMRDISSGEELTVDYAMIDCEGDPMICRCGTSSCRTIIRPTDWKLRELQEKYGNYFAWYLQEKIRAGS